MNKDQLIDAHQFWNAVDFQRLQTRLTRAANSIRQDVLNRHVRALLSEQEINVLDQAVGVITSIKYKVTHAKEDKARREKARQRQLAAYQAARGKLLDTILPKATQPERYLEILTLRLALGINLWAYLGIHGYIGYSNRDMKTRLNKILHTQNPAKLEGFIHSCVDDIRAMLEEYLWDYDEEPKAESLAALLKEYEKKWRTHLPADELAVVAMVNAEMAAYRFFQQIKAGVAK